MNTEFEIIDKYFDGECSEKEETEMFLFLSKEKSAREYFKANYKLKIITNQIDEEFPENLDERILISIKNKAIKDEKFYTAKKNSHLFYYAAAAVLIIGLLLGYMEINNYKANMEATTRKIEKQEKLINLILNNSLPTTEINTKYTNEIIITSEL